MKKLTALLALLLALTLTGCILPDPAPQGTKPPAEEPATEAPAIQMPTTLPAEEETEPDPTQTEPSAVPETTEGAPTEPPFEAYLLKIRNGELPIYAGPGYDQKQVGAIRDKGTYTIVEEKQVRSPEMGLVTWGRLKSGAGWIDLADAKFENKGYCMDCGMEREDGADAKLCMGCGFEGGDHSYCDRCGAETTFRGDVDGLCEDCAAGDTGAAVPCKLCGKNCAYENVKGLCHDCWRNTPNRYCLKCGHGWFTETLTGKYSCEHCGYEFES